jgi:hypothetical protein
MTNHFQHRSQQQFHQKPIEGLQDLQPPWRYVTVHAITQYIYIMSLLESFLKMKYMMLHQTCLIPLALLNRHFVRYCVDIKGKQAPELVPEYYAPIFNACGLKVVMKSGH